MLGACATPDTVSRSSAVDGGASGTEASQDDAASETPDSRAGDPSDTGTNSDSPLPDPNCTILVALTTSPKEVPSSVIVPAGASPRICWTTPSGALLPDADGWDLSLQRSDTTSGDPADAEWSIIRGIPPEKRQIDYGACPPKALACFPAKNLHAGAHVVTIWDGTRVGGLGGAVTFEVR